MEPDISPISFKAPTSAWRNNDPARHAKSRWLPRTTACGNKSPLLFGGWITERSMWSISVLIPEDGIYQSNNPRSDTRLSPKRSLGWRFDKCWEYLAKFRYLKMFVHSLLLDIGPSERRSSEFLMNSVNALFIVHSALLTIAEHQIGFYE